MDFKRLTAAVLLALLLTSTASAQSDNQSLAGRWTPRDRSVVINFAPCGNAAMCGTVTEGILKPSESDLRGQIVIRDLVQRNGGQWVGRYVGDGNNLLTKLRIAGGDNLDVKVCMFSIMCKTQKMTRMR